jgi:hypothetical protein
MYFGTWIDAKESFLQLSFLIACRNIFSRWRLFVISTVEVDYHFPLITISKWQNAVHPRPKIFLNTDSTKPISRLKRDEHDTMSPTHRKLIYLGIRCLSE